MIVDTEYYQCCPLHEFQYHYLCPTVFHPLLFFMHLLKRKDFTRGQKHSRELCAEVYRMFFRRADAALALDQDLVTLGNGHILVVVLR